MNFRLSDPVFTSKYLAALFFVGMLLIGVTDYAPNGKIFQVKAIAVCFQCAILFTLLARVFQDRMPWAWFKTAYAGFAVIMTLLFLVMLVG